MGRKPQSNYVAAARAVLTELGGGPLTSRSLVDAAQERGLIGDGQWTYHNFLRKVRESSEFDTSVRGNIALANAPVNEAAPAEMPVAEVPAPSVEAPLSDDNLGAAVDTTEF